MPRVKRGTHHVKRRKAWISRAKGFTGRRRNVTRLAKTAVTKAGVNAYKGRKQKKRNYRRLWQTRINAALKSEGLSYSKFMGLVHKNKIELDRKILAELAANHPQVFQAVVAEVKK
jgi:large subunit ribosomal protein L20